MAPLYNMTQDGDIYEASGDESDGSGFERTAEWAEMGRNAIGDPVELAAAMREDEQAENEQAQAEEDEQYQADQARMHNRVLRAQYAEAVTEAQAEEEKFANMDQDPLLAMAIAQTMAGADFEQHGLSGHGLSACGDYSSDMTSGMKARLGDDEDEEYDDEEPTEEDEIAEEEESSSWFSDTLDFLSPVAQGAAQAAVQYGIQSAMAPKPVAQPMPAGTTITMSTASTPAQVAAQAQAQATKAVAAAKAASSSKTVQTVAIGAGVLAIAGAALMFLKKK